MPWMVNLGIHVGRCLPYLGSDLAWQTKTSDILLLTCTRCSAVPMANVAVHKCPNLQLTESEPRDVAHIPFIENLGAACMRGSHAGIDPRC